MADQENAQTTPESGQSVAVAEKQQKAVPAEQAKPGKTTAQRLFPDFVGSKVPGSEILSEAKPEAKAEPKAKQEPEPKEEPKPEAKQEEPKYLKPEDFKGSKLKLKVDGVEEEASLEDVIRRAQLDAHLTKKGQRLSEEEKKIRSKEQALEEREKLLNEILAQSNPSQEKADESESFVKDDPYVKKLEDKMKHLESTLEAVTNQARPLFYKSAIERIGTVVKETMGFDDFTQYEPRIREHIMGLPPEQAKSLDSEGGFLAVYKDLKMRDMAQQLKSKPKEEPKPEARTAPKVVPVESGKSAPTGVTDDNASKMRNLFERARRLSAEGSSERHAAWEEYLAFQESQKANT